MSEEKNAAMGRLGGKGVVVTGAGRGIGRAVALLMAAEGARVVVNDRGVGVDGRAPSDAPATEVAEEIRRTGGQAIADTGSVASWEDAERIVHSAVEHFGRLDVLVNVAGILRDRMIFNMGEEEWDTVISVHLKGTFNCVRHACRLMRGQRAGRIINFSSTSGLYGNVGQANYGAAKDGIAGLTRVVAREMGKYGVTCNAIAPAAVTRMTATVPERARQLRAERGVEPAGARPVMLGAPEDVAPFVVYLATDQAAGINGQTFLVMGGFVALLSDPAPVRTVEKPNRWTAQEIGEVFPWTLGIDLLNPAPAERREGR